MFSWWFWAVSVDTACVWSGDLWPEKSTESEPDWVKTEREQFVKYRDTNKDGKMDKDEVQEWIMPDEYDHAKAEATHLIHESDADQVGPGTLPNACPHTPQQTRTSQTQVYVTLHSEIGITQVSLT